MLKLICDRCGEEICNKEKVGYAAAGFKGKTSEEGIENVDTFLEMDFCESCIRKIKEFIKTRKEPAGEGTDDAPEELKPEEQTVPEEKKKRKAKNEGKEPLDYGKIKALYKAGWSQKKIAEEMGTNQTKICKAIGRYDAMIEDGYRWDAEKRIFTIDKAAEAV